MKRRQSFWELSISFLLLLLSFSACWANGVCYRDEYHSAGVEAYLREDDAQAAREFRKLADAGDPGAMHWLGTLYLQGSGVTRNPETAFNWYLKSARAGDCIGQFALSTMYELGIGVAKSYVQAYAWMSLVVKAPGGRNNEWRLNKLKKSMTADELHEAKKLAAEYYQKYFKIF